MEIASLIFGILALLFALVPVYGPLIATPAIVLGIVTANLARKGAKDGQAGRPAKAGLILSVGSIVVMVVNTVGRWG